MVPRFRLLLPFIAVLVAGGCDSGFDPLPPVEPEVQFTTSIDSPDRALLGEMMVTARCEVTVGGIRTQPDHLVVALDGQPTVSEPRTEIQAAIVLPSAGGHVVSVDCTYGEESSHAERTVEAVEPAWVTIHLRNFTQDGEPFVRGEGPITFTVGNVTVTSEDSAVVPVFPNEDYEVFAAHPAFMRHWGRIVDRATEQLVGFRHVWGQSSPVHVVTNTSVEILKIRTSDITSIPNRVKDYWDDTGEFYTIEDFRRILVDPDNPYTGALFPIVGDRLTVFVPYGEDVLPSPMRTTIDRLFRGYGFPHVSILTGGAIEGADVIGGEQSPPIEPRVDIQVGARNNHVEFVTPEGVLSRSSVTITSDVQSQEALTLLLHALGLRGGLGHDTTEDFVDLDGNPSQLALLALKILYASPPNARF